MAWFPKKDSKASDASSTSASAKGVKPLKIASLLSEDVIFFSDTIGDKAQILEKLVQSICQKESITDCTPLLAKAQEREQGISTTLDTGLSLPHARIDGIEKILAAMAILRNPMPDPRQTDLNIRLVFLFFSPNKPTAFPLHLQLLRGVSSLFQPALIDQLTAASTPAAALDLVRQFEG